MLAELRGRGYRIGLLSNCAVPMPYSLQELERQGFAELLDPIVFSSEVGYRKPSPQVFHEAVRRAYPAGPPDELARVMYVGDSPRLDVTAPASLGMRTALVTREPGVWPEEDYAAARPDLQIDAVTQLPDRLNHRGESV
jgi:putative hydrolase of the HAD superfamily